MPNLPKTPNGEDKAAFYELLCAQAAALTEGEADCIANLANVSALLWQSLADINWAGFYRAHVKAQGMGRADAHDREEGESDTRASREDTAEELILAPFAGLPACIHIAPGRGVCGTALAQDATQLVADVHRFAGHIACDSASNSEIVVPLHHAGRVVGVLDIDSPLLTRFDEADRAGLEALAKIVEDACGAQLARLKEI